MNDVDRLSKIISQNKPQSKIGITVGKVISASPVEIAITSEITAKGRSLIVSASVGTLIAGDNVIVCASDNNQKFFVIGKVAE